LSNKKAISDLKQAIKLAIEEGDIKKVKKYFATGRVNIDEKLDSCWTALHIASAGNKKNIVEYLLKNSANVHIEDGHGNIALKCAIDEFEIDKEIVSLLIKYGSNINDQAGDFQETPLMIATEKYHHDIVDVLLKDGANINLKNIDGQTALHIAVDNKDYKIINLLLNNNANHNIKDNKGNSPLKNIFLKKGNYPFNVDIDKDLKIFKLLVNFGADINTQNNEGETILMYLAKTNQYEVITELLSYKMDIDIQDNKGNTALMHAAIVSLELVELLVKSAAT